MPEYLTPGVYFERADVAPPVNLSRMDVAGFVGIASRGPVGSAVAVESWRQYEAYFGDFSGAGYLAYAVRGFFENGGQRCWVTRVADADVMRSAEATLHHLDAAGAPAARWRVVAHSPGAWGNELSYRLVETHRAQTRSKDQRTSPDALAVESVSGFKRGTHVRLTEPGGGVEYRVVAGVEAFYQRLEWFSRQPMPVLPWELPYGPSQPLPPSAPDVLVESVEYTLQIYHLCRLVRAYAGLSLVPESEDYGPRRLPPFDPVPLPGMRQTFPPVPEPVAILEMPAPQDLASVWRTANLASLIVPGGPRPSDRQPVDLTGGADGLATLTADDFIGQQIDPQDDDATVRRKRRGLRVLDEIAEVSMLAVPDIHIQPIEMHVIQPQDCPSPDPCRGGPAVAPPTPVAAPATPPTFRREEILRVQSAMVQMCERRQDRMAILDAPFDTVRDEVLGTAEVLSWREQFETKYAACYYPWLSVVDPLRSPDASGSGEGGRRRLLAAVPAGQVGRLTRDIPPSGHVAGQYALAERRRGVHQAPANAPLGWVHDLTALVDDARHGVLNPLGINVIRSLPGRGIRIYGARTVSSDPDHKFVNVRRLLLMVRRSVDKSLQWATFEPNNGLTRSKLKLVLTGFLLALWQRGALVGVAPEAAFFVKCDEDNNPPDARANGRLQVDIGLAPSVPYEFVVLRVGRTANELEISESMLVASGL